MKVIRTIDAMRRFVRRAKGEEKLVGFVPTLGGLHEGHFSLFDAAAADCPVVVASIFLNPTQFAPTEDLASYPADERADLAACRAHGVSAAFVPAVAEMYPAGPAQCLTSVAVAKLGEHLCGRSRPGHFAGVCTVVLKLLNIVQPDRAYFGAKDYQQAAIVRRMAGDLNVPAAIVVRPTVREDDGLALSTRNRYLTAEQRGQAAALHAALKLGERMLAAPPVSGAEVAAAMRAYLSEHAPAGNVDYIELVDADTLAPVERPAGRVLVALAVKFERARLIDSLLVDAGGPRR